MHVPPGRAFAVEALNRTLVESDENESQTDSVQSSLSRLPIMP